MTPLIVEILEYIDSESDNFDFGDGRTNLKVGEPLEGQDAIFAVQTASIAPDKDLPIRYLNIDFYCKNVSTEQAFTNLEEIITLLHQQGNWSTATYFIEFSYANSDIEDFDRDLEGRKVLRVPFTFIYYSLIS